MVSGKKSPLGRGKGRQPSGWVVNFGTHPGAT
jgi:hypothetical protein